MAGTGHARWKTHDSRAEDSFFFLGRFLPLVPRQILPRLLLRSPLPIDFLPHLSFNQLS